MESFKQRMKRIRLRAGFKSQGDAATAIGCERGTVGMWEAPSSNVSSVGEWLLQTAHAYKVRPEWLNNLRSDDDGYPWQSAIQSQSHSARLSGEIILSAYREAVMKYESIGLSATSFKPLTDPDHAELFALAVIAQMTQPETDSGIQVEVEVGRGAAGKDRKGSGSAGKNRAAETGRESGASAGKRKERAA